jgi:hypothetical protein
MCHGGRGEVSRSATPIAHRCQPLVGEVWSRSSPQGLGESGLRATIDVASHRFQTLQQSIGNADAVAEPSLPLDDQDPDPGLCEHPGQRRSREITTDNDDIERLYGSHATSSGNVGIQDSRSMAKV